jgi:hypothetical protein
MFCKSTIPSIIGLPESWNVNCQAIGESVNAWLDLHKSRWLFLKEVYVKLFKIWFSINAILNKVSFNVSFCNIVKNTITEIIDIVDPKDATSFQPKNASG